MSDPLNDQSTLGIGLIRDRIDPKLGPELGPKLGPELGAGATIGQYRVVRLLGAGGMGVVYEAEQQQPRRTVALKVIKPGLASPELLRRFAQESQALARVQHPGIAQIYEAGTFDTGFGPQPYFAMEFIRGRPLTDYAESRNLSTRQRLEILAKVCEAVHHAHQRGLIHRDLKPGNILVDETGHPRILDFGVARVTDGDAQATLYTNVGEIVGTLAYMSPEQVLADPLELDTRSDVYALGVILYELLAGRLPYKISRKVHEAVQTIREEDPTRLSSIKRTYRGDIETIVAKALEKDKARRYGSASSLADDIRRYLKDEPIIARPSSTTYQLQKFARRHKALVAGIVAVFIVLVAGITVSTWQAARATLAEQDAIQERDRATAAEQSVIQERDRALNAERDATGERNRAVAAEAQAVQERNRAFAEKQRADNESATAKAVNEFLQNDLLAQASASVQARPDTRPDPDLKVRTALDRAAARIAGKFSAQPLVEASIRETIGQTYIDLGLFPEAQQHRERAVELRRSAQGKQHPDTLRSISNLAGIYRLQSKYTLSEALHTEVLEIRRRTLGEEHLLTAESMNNLSIVLANQGKHAQAEVLQARALEIRRRALGAQHLDTVSAMQNLAEVYRGQGKYPQAVTLYNEVLEVRTRIQGKDHPETLRSTNNLAGLYEQQNKLSEAETLHTQALDVKHRVLGPEHPDTLLSMNNRAIVYYRQGNLIKAETDFTHVLDIQRRLLGEEHRDTLGSMSNLATVYSSLGKFENAELLSGKMLEIQQKVFGPEHPNTITAINNLGGLYRIQGKYGPAEPLFVRALEARRRLLGDEHPNTLISMNNLGGLYRAQRKFAEAAPLLSRTLEVRRRVLGPDNLDTFGSMNDLAMLFWNQEKYAEAEELFTQALAGRRRILGPQHANTTSVMASVGRVRLLQQKYTEAEPLLRESLNIFEKTTPVGWTRYDTQSMLGASLAGQGKYADAEPLLLSGYQGLLQHERALPPEVRPFLEHAGERIVHLYQSWGKPEKAAEWRQKLRKAPPGFEN